MALGTGTAINRYMYTDTNTGVNSNTGKYTPSTTGNTNNTSTGTVNYVKPTAPTQADRDAGKAALANRTAQTSTPVATTSTPVQTTTPTTSYTRNYGYSGGGSGGTTTTTTEEPVVDNVGKLWESVANDVRKGAINQEKAMTNNANAYNKSVTNNLSRYEDIYNKMYQENLDNINNYRARNDAAQQQWQDVINQTIAAQREADARYESQLNTSINNYYNNMKSENASREAATLDAINAAYDAIMANAGEYYNNVLGTYNRSMDWVNQGFNQGKQATMDARDEAIQLAQQLYEMGEQTQNRQAERGLNSQYVSYMQGLRNLNQKLASQGINGGASETSMLGALNGYESNRTDIEEARLAALGLLRQQQMQSSSEAQQSYLAKLADLIQNRTTNQLGVENTRAQGEYNYANMKNSAESNKGDQMVTAQNNFQNWAANLESNYANMNQNATTNARNWNADTNSNEANWNQNLINNARSWDTDATNMASTNNNTYTNNSYNLANAQNDQAANYASMQNSAAAVRNDAMNSAAYIAALQGLAEKNVDYDSKMNSKTKKEKEKEAKKKAEKKAKEQNEKIKSNIAKTVKELNKKSNKKKNSKSNGGK